MARNVAFLVEAQSPLIEKAINKMQLTKDEVNYTFPVARYGSTILPSETYGSVALGTLSREDCLIIPKSTIFCIAGVAYDDELGQRHQTLQALRLDIPSRSRGRTVSHGETVSTHVQVICSAFVD